MASGSGGFFDDGAGRATACSDALGRLVCGAALREMGRGLGNGAACAICDANAIIPVPNIRTVHLRAAGATVDEGAIGVTTFP